MKDIDAKKGRKTVLLLTDGLDNNRKETEATSTVRANQAGLACFTVGLGSADFTNLQNISKATGGRFYQSVSSAQLIDIFANVFYIMDNLVKVGFRSRIGELKANDNTRELTILNYNPTLSTSRKKTYGY